MKFSLNLFKILLHIIYDIITLPLTLSYLFLAVLLTWYKNFFRFFYKCIMFGDKHIYFNRLRLLHGISIYSSEKYIRDFVQKYNFEDEYLDDDAFEKLQYMVKHEKSLKKALNKTYAKNWQTQVARFSDWYVPISCFIREVLFHFKFLVFFYIGGGFSLNNDGYGLVLRPYQLIVLGDGFLLEDVNYYLIRLGVIYTFFSYLFCSMFWFQQKFLSKRNIKNLSHSYGSRYTLYDFDEQLPGYNSQSYARGIGFHIGLIVTGLLFITFFENMSKGYTIFNLPYGYELSKLYGFWEFNSGGYFYFFLTIAGIFNKKEGSGLRGIFIFFPLIYLTGGNFDIFSEQLCTLGDFGFALTGKLYINVFDVLVVYSYGFYFPNLSMGPFHIILILSTIAMYFSITEDDFISASKRDIRMIHAEGGIGMEGRVIWRSMRAVERNIKEKEGRLSRIDIISELFDFFFEGFDSKFLTSTLTEEEKKCHEEDKKYQDSSETLPFDELSEDEGAEVDKTD